MKRMDVEMRLSENFTLGEFTRSETARKYDVSNEPSWEAVLNLMALCKNVLQPLRDRFGVIHINSGYRSERLNELVRGVGNSQHLYGEAADIRIVNTRQGLDFFDFIRDHCEFDQLLFEYRRDGAKWLHVSCKRNGKLNRFMAIPNYIVSASC